LSLGRDRLQQKAILAGDPGQFRMRCQGLAQLVQGLGVAVIGPIDQGLKTLPISKPFARRLRVDATAEA